MLNKMSFNYNMSFICDILEENNACRIVFGSDSSLIFQKRGECFVEILNLGCYVSINIEHVDGDKIFRMNIDVKTGESEMYAYDRALDKESSGKMNTKFRNDILKITKKMYEHRTKIYKTESGMLSSEYFEFIADDGRIFSNYEQIQEKEVKKKMGKQAKRAAKENRRRKLKESKKSKGIDQCNLIENEIKLEEEHDDEVIKVNSLKVENYFKEEKNVTSSSEKKKNGKVSNRELKKMMNNKATELTECKVNENTNIKVETVNLVQNEFDMIKKIENIASNLHETQISNVLRANGAPYLKYLLATYDCKHKANGVNEKSIILYYLINSEAIGLDSCKRFVECFSKGIPYVNGGKLIKFSDVENMSLKLNKNRNISKDFYFKCLDFLNYMITKYNIQFKFIIIYFT